MLSRVSFGISYLIILFTLDQQRIYIYNVVAEVFEKNIFFEIIKKKLFNLKNSGQSVQMNYYTFIVFLAIY